MADITRPEYGTGTPRASRFRERRLSPSHMFITEA